MTTENDIERAASRIDAISRAFAARPSLETMQAEIGKHLTGVPAVDEIILEWADRTLQAWMARRESR